MGGEMINPIIFARGSAKTYTRLNNLLCYLEKEKIKYLYWALCPIRRWWNGKRSKEFRSVIL